MSILSREPAEAAPARIRPIATLPVFLDLRGRPALVAGGSAAAAWKAELLAAAGASVTVVAEEPDPVLSALAAAGAVTLVARCWSPGDLVGAGLAVCDAVDEAEAAGFAEAARAAGVPYNVIDRPQFCSLRFGTIVNRSPLVVGISTDGAAPILGQAARQRIEAVLPPGLAGWAALAGRLRARVMREVRPGEPRRRFWEAFARRAFSDPEPAAVAVEPLLSPGPAAGEGRVSLVGAGPGDPELLTLKAIRALQSADVILFDDLVGDEVLELARREAKRVQVGKRGGRPSCRQEDINGLMIALARAGRHVVRLKSGDPMVFGRAGEEIAALEGAGIRVEVVPGITAGIALAARLGVSLTERGSARSVRLVTAHGRDGALPSDLDWRGLADPDTTLIVYMGGRCAAALAARLVAEGLDPETPAVVAEAVSRPEEQVVRLTLAGLARRPAEWCARPVVIGIGRVLASGQAAACETATAGETG